MHPRILNAKMLEAINTATAACSTIADRAGLDFDSTVTAKGPQMTNLRRIEKIASFLDNVSSINGAGNGAKLPKVDDLTLIDGITPETAVSLYSGGILTVAQVAEMSVDALTAIPGIGAVSAKKIKTAAAAVGG